MATTTRVLSASVNGTVYTTNANGALEAIDTCHSGSSAPTNEVANGKLWLDTTTTPGILKMYNNAAWEVVLTATGTSQVKLDDIEALADVTDTANVTSAGALMDSELTDIASVKALNQGVATTDNPRFARLTMDATNPSILSSDADGFLTVSGDSSGTIGGNMRFYSAAHASNAGDIVFRTNNTQTLKYDASDTAWKFQANDLVTTGTMTATDFVGDGSALTGIGTAAASLAAGAVGSYAFLIRTTAYVVFGTTYSGSYLRPAGLSSSSISTGGISHIHDDENADLYLGPGTSASAVSGTWRCMGQTTSVGNQDNGVTLFLRIS